MDTMPSQPEPGLGAIVHIGAGIGGDLANYTALRPEKVVLIEPNPDAVPELSEAAAAAPFQTQVLEAAVGAKSGKAALNVFNFFDLSSLAAPTGLTDLFPGLTVKVRPRVTVLTLAKLFKQITLSDDRSNWLVIDAPGSEPAIVHALVKNAALTRFQRIILTAPRRKLYKGGVPADKLAALLADEDFLAEPADAVDADPEWQTLHLVFSEELNKERKLAAERAAETEKAQAALAELQDALEKERARAAALEKERTQLQKDLAESEKAQAALAELQDALEKERARAAALEKERTQLQEDLADARKAIETAKSNLAEERESLQHTLNMALHMQTMAQIDLNDLRERYSALGQEKSKQEALLVKLTQRLGDAADYLHELSDMDAPENRARVSQDKSGDA